MAKLKPDEIVKIATGHYYALELAQQVLADYQRHQKQWNTLKAETSQDDRDHLEVVIAYERSSYNQTALATGRALADVGIDPLDLVAREGTAQQVDVICAATLTDVWGPQVGACALRKLQLGMGEWGAIMRDPSAYMPE